MQNLQWNCLLDILQLLCFSPRCLVQSRCVILAVLILVALLDATQFGNLETLMNFLVFSERELTFTFAICCRLSVCLLSVVCLTVVCNARAPYSGGSNFPQYFYGVRYLGHPLTSTENFTEIVPGVAKYSDFGPIDGYVSETAQDRR